MAIDDIGAPRPRPPGDGADRRLSIGEFARRSRLSLKALRLYDRLEVLRPDSTDPRTGYRRYRESQLPVARLVAALRHLDMPLTEVAAVVSAADGSTRAGLIGDYWSTVEARTAVGREVAAHLQRRLSGAAGSTDTAGVRHRRVGPVRVITESGRMYAPELSVWLGDRMPRLAARAAALAGPSAAAPFVVYHGEVSLDSDGPVEICQPLGDQPTADGATDSRLEPAHREAFVRLRKAQVGYPQILSALDLLEQWIADRGLRAVGPPREVYFTDFVGARLADEVCDLAVPLD